MPIYERERRAEETVAQLRDSAFGGFIGSLALSIVYVLLARGHVAGPLLLSWVAVSIVATFALFASTSRARATRRRDRTELPYTVRATHITTGVVWGALFLIPSASTRAGEPPLIELCVAFALSAGAAGGAGFSRLGRDVVIPTWLLAIAGTLFYGEFVVAGGAAVFLAVVLRDMRISEQQYDELRELRSRADDAAAAALESSERDGLTGLLNRVGLERVASDLRSGDDKPITMMFVDLDRFKEVNDTLGHAAGDTVLRVIADRLAASVRESDVVCRIGGDEFFLLLAAGPNEHEAEAVAELLLAAISAPIELDGLEVSITASVGFGGASTRSLDLEGAYSRTDQAMYAAKRKGRGMAASMDAVRQAGSDA